MLGGILNIAKNFAPGPVGAALNFGSMLGAGKGGKTPKSVSKSVTTPNGTTTTTRSFQPAQSQAQGGLIGNLMNKLDKLTSMLFGGSSSGAGSMQNNASTAMNPMNAQNAASTANAASGGIIGDLTRKLDDLSSKLFGNQPGGMIGDLTRKIDDLYSKLFGGSSSSSTASTTAPAASTTAANTTAPAASGGGLIADLTNKLNDLSKKLFG